MKDEYFNTVKTIFMDTVVPNQLQLLQCDIENDKEGYTAAEVEKMTNIIHEIIIKCSQEPEKVICYLIFVFVIQY